MSRKPITMNAGQPEQLPDGAALNVGGWDLPAAIGTVLYALVSNGSNSVWTQLDHGTHLAGLSDPGDHPQYLLVDGSRALGGNWSLGGYNLTNVGLFGGVDVPTMNSFFNGTFQETFDATVTSNGTAITMSLEQSGTGDLTMQFSDGYTTLDCTDPPQTIALTAGSSDSSPQANYIYIPQSTKVLTKSTSTWPAGECIRVAYFLVPSATFVQTHGCYINQNWNDHLAAANSQGHMPHMSEKLRRLGASWFSGVNANGATASYFTIGFNTTDWLSTEGEVDQLHEHTFPAVETSGSDTVLVVNQSGAAYDDITDLYSITDDNTGATISNNRYFNLVFWGVVNKSGEFSALMVNLPGGFYVKQSDALIDSDNHDVYDIPREFSIDSGTAFLICRSTFQMGTTWAHVSTTDLRGLTPATASGSSVNDHGGLGGLTDDDHAAYHTDARAATWLAANHETTYNHANHDTAYGWGDHASGGYLKADGTVPLTAHWAAGAYNITGLALLTVDNITIDAATIVSDTGAISFNDENVSTSGTMVGSNIPSPSADDQVLIATASGVAAWSTAGANQLLASDSDGAVAWTDKGGSNYTCFMSLTGNDTTGDGTHGSPWLTFNKCIAEIEARYFVASDTATIHIEPGNYTGLGTFTFPRIAPEIVLTADTVHTKAMSDIVAVTNVSGDLWDVEIQLDTITNLTTDMYGLIENGSDLPALNGCWEVRSFDDTGTNTVTLRIHYEDLLAVGPPVAGLDTATIYFPTVTLNRSGGNLLLVYSRDLTVSNMVLVGTTASGIYSRAFSRTFVGSHVGLTGWSYGARAFENCIVEIRTSAISLCTHGVFSDVTSRIWFIGAAVSGCSTAAFNVNGNSFCYIDTSYISSNSYGLLMSYGSPCRVANTTFSFHTVIACRSQYASFVHATGSCVFTDNNDDFQPNVDVQGNDNSWNTR